MKKHPTQDLSASPQVDLKIAHIRCARRYQRDISGDFHTIKNHVADDQGGSSIGGSPASRIRLEPKGRM
jgi:hypothetical protein